MKCKREGCFEEAFGLANWCSDQCLKDYNLEQRKRRRANGYTTGSFEWGSSVEEMDSYIRGFQERVAVAFGADE